MPLLSKEQFKELVDELNANEDAHFYYPTGYEDCCYGVCDFMDKDPCLVFSVQAILRKLVGDGCTPEGAIEYFEFNILGAYMGEGMPGFIRIHY